MTKKKESWLSGFGHSVFGRSREPVAEGLDSSDAATRTEAASKLHQVNGPKLDLAIKCLADPVQVIRQHGLRTMLGVWEGRDYLTTFLSSADPGVAPARDVAISDLLALNGTGAPFEGKPLAKALSYTYVVGNGVEGTSNVFRDALVAAKAGPALLPLLTAASKAGLLPAPVAPWVRDFDLSTAAMKVMHVGTGDWPSRCSSCGSPDAAMRVVVSFEGEVGRTYLNLNQFRVETVKGTLPVPVCARPECQVAPTAVVSYDGLAIGFRSPEFIAELIGGGHWRLLPAPKPWKKQVEEEKERKAAKPAVG